jgi:hypothetical protein
MRVQGLLLSLLLSAGTASAQDYLNCHLVPGWEPSGAKRDYVADSLFEYKDGAAEGYLSFGFVRMQGITCASGGSTLDIDVSEMGDADSAYGMFAANMDTSLPVARIGMGGQIQKQSASFARGKYYVELVEVAANPDSDDTATMKAFVARMLEHLEGRDTPPAALDWFEKENLTQIRLVPESVLGLRELKRGYVAKYKQGQGLIVQQDSPEAAAAVLNSLRQRFAGAEPVHVGDEGFQTTAKYLDGICFFRKGKIVGGYTNLLRAKDATVQAGILASRIP